MPFQLYPVIPGVTAALWQFQGSLLDSSGNGLHLATLDGETQHTPGGLEQYGALDAFTQGFKFNGFTKLWAPLSPLLQLAGDFTFEWFMFQSGTGSMTYFSSANPAGRSGGASPDRTGSLYSFFWGSPNNPYYRQENTGGGGGAGGATYGRFNAQTVAWGVGSSHRYAFRRSGTRMDGFFDGAKVTPDVPTWDSQDLPPNIATGVERFFLGGFEGPGFEMNTNSIIGSFRAVNVARTDAEIAAGGLLLPGRPTGGFGGGEVGARARSRGRRSPRPAHVSVGQMRRRFGGVDYRTPDVVSGGR